ncbi:MAG: VapC toxin family PIN domain ribonuclease, partial [Desulfobacterales bacterium]
FSKQRNYLESFLENVIRQNIDILPYDEKAAQWHALNRARLSAEGKTPSFVDGQIAGIAYTNGLILVTRNMSDFRIFPDLQIKNWHRSV